MGSEDGKLYAFDASTGTQRWTADLGAIGSQTSPAVANGVVYMGGYQDHVMHALDAGSGQELWTYTTGGIMNDSPGVADGVLYFGSFDDTLYAFALP